MRPRLTSIALTLLALLALPSVARAGCGGGTVIPGATICLQPFFATSSVTAVGVSDKNVRFTVGVGGVEIFNQGSSTSFSESWDSGTNPSYFPGYFLVCAHRGSQHGTSAEVTLCIDGN